MNECISGGIHIWGEKVLNKLGETGTVATCSCINPNCDINKTTYEYGARFFSYQYDHIDLWRLSDIDSWSV